MANTPSSQVYQLKNGRWAFRFSISVNGKQISKRGKTDLDGNPLLSRADATKARKKAIKMAQLAPLLPEKKPEPIKRTVRDVFKEYREKGCSDRAYATIRKQDSLWKNHLDAAFGDRIIDEIPTADVVDYLAKLYYDDGFAFRYVESFIKMFYLIFGQPYSRGYMSVDSYNRLCVNKDTKIHMPKLKIDEDLDVVAFTNEECAILDEYFTGTSGETAYLLGRYCGLRINESYGLKWENVNIEEGTIRIEQQMQYQDGLIKLVPLKTRNARRTIYLSKRLIAHFKALEEQQRSFTPTQLAQREQNKTFITDVDDSMISSLLLVNTLPNGHIQTVNTMKYHTRVIKEKFGIAFKYHYLRHTYGTQLAVLNTPTHINYIENTITVTKKFLKDAGIIGSAAYNELARVRKDLPDFQIVQREIAKKQGKKTYGKLTYETMADFITVKEEENAPAVLAEFERVKALSKVQAGQYAFVKTWFLNRYKDEFQQEETEEAVA